MAQRARGRHSGRVVFGCGIGDASSVAYAMQNLCYTAMVIGAGSFMFCRNVCGVRVNNIGIAEEVDNCDESPSSTLRPFVDSCFVLSGARIVFVRLAMYCRIVVVMAVNTSVRGLFVRVAFCAWFTSGVVELAPM